MIAEIYREWLEPVLGRRAFLLLTLIVASLQLFKQVKLETLAENLPLPILFESRRKLCRRFLSLPTLSVETLWFPGVSQLLGKLFTPGDTIYLAIDRTHWSTHNILMVSVIYDRRAWPVYWQLLPHLGNSNLAEQQAVLQQAFRLLQGYKIVLLGDREFCAVGLAKWLREEGVGFCLRQKCSTKVEAGDDLFQALRDYGLIPGTKLFLRGKQVTRQSGFGKFNIAGKWQRGYRGQVPAEPWYILTSFGDLETTIRAYSQRFDIEEMFRDFKSGGYNLEGCRLASERLDKLLVIVAIAYTSAWLQGQTIKRLGIQKYVARPEQRGSKSRRHSAFYVGQQVHHWVQLGHFCQDIVAELCQINRRCLQFYLKGERAIELALSTF